MDTNQHAQLIYAHLLQAWTSEHQGSGIAAGDLQNFAQTALQAAAIFWQVAQQGARGAGD